MGDQRSRSSRHKPVDKVVLIVASLLAVLVTSSGLSGCGGPSLMKRETGSVRVVAVIPQGIAARTSARLTQSSELVITLTNGYTVASQTAQVVDGRAEARFSAVLVGEWSIEASLKDENGDIIYAGSGKVNVVKDQESGASILLMPAKGNLELYVDLSGVPGQEQVNKVRLYKDSTNLQSQVDLMREPGSSVVCGRVGNMLPKVYDMRLKLYTAEGEVLYETPWRPVGILPGKTTVVNWEFASGNISVITELDLIPEAPGGLTAQFSNGVVSLTWDPVYPPEGDLAGYTIYRKEPPFGGYKGIGELGPETSFIDQDVDAGKTYQYAVTARDLAGHESPRSNEVMITCQ